MSRTVLVLGSLNMDLRVHAPRVPLVGETILGSDFGTDTGGKGGNQAMAAARVGASVRMLGCVGDDAFGVALREALVQAGVDTRDVSAVPGWASGVGVITVQTSGDNSIIVAPGANQAVSEAWVQARLPQAMAGAGVLVAQLECPLASVALGLRLARAAGLTTVLNLAPAAVLAAAVLRDIDVLVLNESEAELLTGLPVQDEAQVAAAVRQLLSLGPNHVVLTLGAQGLLHARAGASGDAPDLTRHAGFAVKAVDTTGAGDTLVGVLAAGLAQVDWKVLNGDQGPALWSAILRRAQAAAALSVTRPGAQSAMPTQQEVDAFLSPSGPTP